MQAVATISDFNISPAPLVLIDLVFVVIFFALLVASSGWLAAVPLAIFILFGVAAIERGRELRDITAERMVAETKIRDFLIEAMNGIVTVKALGTEQQILRRFERLSEQAARCTYNVVRLADDAQSFGSMVSILTQIATATIGAILAINGEISIGVVACSTMLAGRVIQPLLRLVSAWNEIQGVMVAEEIAKPIFDLPKSDRLSAPARDREHQPAGLCSTMSGSLMAAESEPVLAGASLEVTPGEIIAITGKDNIGKSTVARLAAGQLVPECWPRAGRRRRGLDGGRVERGSVAWSTTRMPPYAAPCSTISRCSVIPSSSRRRAQRHAQSASKATSIGCRAATTRASERRQPRPCPLVSCSASRLPGRSPASPACSFWTRPTARWITRAI